MQKIVASPSGVAVYNYQFIYLLENEIILAMLDSRYRRIINILNIRT